MAGDLAVSNQVVVLAVQGLHYSLCALTLHVYRVCTVLFVRVYRVCTILSVRVYRVCTVLFVHVYRVCAVLAVCSPSTVLAVSYHVMALR